MKPALERLVALSRLDTRLQGIENTLKKLPEDEKKAQTRLHDANTALEGFRERLRQVELSRREGEREAESLVQQERKFQSQTMQVKSNEELWALQREIQSVKTRRSEVETLVLERMEEEERNKREGSSFDKGVAEAKAHVSQVATTNAAERARLEAERDQAKAERDRELEEVPREWRSRYERVRQNRGSPAVVPLVRNACAGCMTQQPPQRVQEVRLGDAVVVCEFCGRLIIGVEGGAPSPA
ncbi:MAG TPA: C4-type zinc ribbon domain-containing protein [Candidatus Eisenbacteria bacterium]|nr:C4-type zinc ribbon domain-containing protein [Candidatus Eisenbacteria bacterium]